MNETNQEIWAGNYDPILGLLTNVHTVDLELISQKTCSLNLKMTLKEKQDFVFQFGNDHKIKQEVKCKLSGTTAEEQFKNWETDMREPLSAPNYGIENYFLSLHLLKIFHYFLCKIQANRWRPSMFHRMTLSCHP